MQCYNYYSLFSLPGSSFSLKLSILRYSSDLFRNVYEKVVYEKKVGLPKIAYLEMSIDILVPKVSEIL